ncbi:sensor histidine kinase [Pseudoalteromonas sp. A757]|uniref:sensor histidine kinase n=1 Tax=Pseudoalteromonas sp. A757 TaxID=2250709 RepID=UPI000FFED560|nr:sensor histidine kinase [Pseudoalteromonas sp. A757]RXE86243.1 histidine kinase [Pseudoalteromonas sp. A757]
MNSIPSIQSVSFKARARTIDHLGKGQIADAPTAISELWKNSYDAYARNVALHLYDDDIKCGAIIDDGCGMTFDQLSDSWITIGTESKTKKSLLPEADRFGLNERFTQGEKGIGRLSTAFLAPVTLIVTKKINSRYSAALIDWRLFENMYLSLNDVKVPMSEFERLEDLPALCKELQKDMLNNLAVEPKTDDTEALLLRKAWEKFSKDEFKAFNAQKAVDKHDQFQSTEDKIQTFCESFRFNQYYLRQWKTLLKNVSELDGETHGTALFLLDLNRDLEVLTNRGDLDRNADEYRAIEENLVDTLRAFVNPYLNEENEQATLNRTETAEISKEDDSQNEKELNFNYEIKQFDKEFWITNRDKTILDYHDNFRYHEFQKLEHKVEGVIDEKGWFRGSVTAFGVDFKNIRFSCRSSGMNEFTSTGEFKIQLGAFEAEPAKSTHNKDEFDFITEQAKKYSGLMIFRDNLRVLPYGRIDNDFFEIEERRSLSAGRYFFSSRRLFGLISLNQTNNGKLRDKAGREGFIRNQTAIEFKSLVRNLLNILADSFFGAKSDNRQEMLAQLSKNKKKQKKAQKASAKINKKTFITTLSKNEPVLNSKLKEIKELHSDLDSGVSVTLSHLDELVKKIEQAEQLRADINVPNKPAKIDDDLEDRYRTYRDMFAELSELLSTCKTRLNELEAKGKFISPIESAEKKYKSCETTLNKQLSKYTNNIEKTFERLFEFWRQQAREDKKLFESQSLELLDNVTNDSDVTQTLNALDKIAVTLADDFAYKYDAFLRALEKLENGIDLDSAFIIAEEEHAKAEREVNQIRSLAQLGISFEVIAHELSAQDQLVTRSLNSMSSDAKQQIGFQNALRAHKQFTEYLRFLSPLKLSGYQPRDDISGSEIVKNIEVFFRDRFEKQHIDLIISDRFKRMNVVDVKSRIIPVFINILNNAIYWVGLSDHREIKIDIANDLVVIANTGPAVDQDDIERLFELFYSRRSGGNGVGLYLSQQNLAVAHHKIWYAVDENEKLIKDGANFVIQFRGMEIR